jgi:hypothetical protein
MTLKGISTRSGHPARWLNRADSGHLSCRDQTAGIDPKQTLGAATAWRRRHFTRRVGYAFYCDWQPCVRIGAASVNSRTTQALSVARSIRACAAMPLAMMPDQRRLPSLLSRSEPPTSGPPKRLCDFLVGLRARKSDVAEHPLVKRSERSAANGPTAPLP